MFDIAWSELLLIAVIALIFIGPKELPSVMHSVGKALSKLRRTADDFKRQFEESMRESGYDDLHRNIKDFRAINPASQLKDSINRAISQDYTTKPSVPVDHAAEGSAGTLSFEEPKAEIPSAQLSAAADHLGTDQPEKDRADRAA
jgi:sec-independent protein translocase protein TatB